MEKSMEPYNMFVVTLRSFIVSAVLFEESLESFDKLAWSELSFEMISLAVRVLLSWEICRQRFYVLPQQSSPPSSPQHGCSLGVMRKEVAKTAVLAAMAVCSGSTQDCPANSQSWIGEDLLGPSLTPLNCRLLMDSWGDSFIVSNCVSTGVHRILMDSSKPMVKQMILVKLSGLKLRNNLPKSKTK